MSLLPEDFRLDATRSPNDHKNYHLFTLPANGLQCLLIQGINNDDESAAAQQLRRRRAKRSGSRTRPPPSASAASTVTPGRSMRMESSPEYRENGKSSRRSRTGSSKSSRKDSSSRRHREHRHGSSMVPNLNDALSSSRSSVDFDFVQSVDLAELQRSGKIKRSKSFAVSNSSAGGTNSESGGSSKFNRQASGFFNKRRSSGQAKGGLKTAGTFRSRLAGSMSIRSNNTKRDLDSDGDENDEQSVAAAVAALSLDPDMARATLHFANSRSDLYGPGEQGDSGHNHNHSHRVSVADGALGPGVADDDEHDIGRLAAVCMAVGVGSLSDPADLNGMAHFLEHMLSMGSKEFPLENDFESFLSRNGGRYNAYTESEEVIFFFEVREDALVRALEMFGSFFVAPLLRLESAQREINSVQSELSLLMNNDDFRIAQVWRETAKPGTPYENFNVGSNATLEPLLSDLSPMREFFDRFYVAANMKLTVFTTDSSSNGAHKINRKTAGVSSIIHDTMVRVFSNVSGEALKKPVDPTRSHTAHTNFASFGMPWVNPSEVPESARVINFDDNASERSSGTDGSNRQPPSTRPDAGGSAIGCVYRIVALHAGAHRMRFSFPLPPKKRMQDEDVHHYVSYIIGHESKGGILAELKAKGWATYLAAGVGDGGQTSTTGYRIFVVQVLLTPVGLREWVQVAGVLFQFIGQVMMKGGPQERFFDEYTAVQHTKHEYYEEPEPLALVKWCARMLLPRHKVPNSQLLRARLNTRWQPKEIERFCKALVPTNCRIDLSSKLYERLAKRNMKKATGNSNINVNKKQAREDTSDHLPSKDLASRIPYVESFSHTVYWVDRIPASIFDTWQFMFDGQLKLYLRNQVGHDLLTTPGLALPPVNPFISKTTKHMLLSYKLDTLNFETIWMILEALGIDSRAGRKGSSSRRRSKDQTPVPPYTLRWDGEEVMAVDANRGLVMVASPDLNNLRFRVPPKMHRDMVDFLETLVKKSKNSHRLSVDLPGLSNSSLYPLTLVQNAPMLPPSLLNRDSFSSLPTHPSSKTKTGLSDSAKRFSQVPVLVSNPKDEGLLKMWILPEKKPKVPYVSAFLKLVFPRALLSAKSTCFMDLFVNLVKDSLHNELFMATEAGLKVRITNNDDGVGMHFEGLGHAIPLLITKCVKGLLNFGVGLPSWDPVSTTAFETQLEATIMQYRSEFGSGRKKSNGSGGDTANNVEGSMKSMLVQNTFNPQERIEVLQKKKFSLAVFAKQVALIMTQCHVQGLMVGNVDYDTAHVVCYKILKCMHTNGIQAPGKLPNLRPVIVAKCPPGALSGVMQLGVSASQGQSLSLHYQIGQDNRHNRIVALLLQQLMSQPLFHQLRTLEQVGYAVSCECLIYFGMVGLSIHLVSDTQSPTACIETVENFLLNFRNVLAGLPIDQIAESKAALAANLDDSIDENNSIKVKASKLWKLTKTGTNYSAGNQAGITDVASLGHQWDRYSKDAAAVRLLDLADLLEIYDRALFPRSVDRRRATMVVTARNYAGLPDLLLSLLFNVKVTLANGTEPKICTTFKKMSKGRRNARKAERLRPLIVS